MSEIATHSEVSNDDPDDLITEFLALRSFETLDFSTRDTVYQQVEDLISEYTGLITPAAMGMHFYNSKFLKSPVPMPATVSIQRVPSLSDRGGLWLVDGNRDVITIAVVAQISHYPDDLKCGEYLDMNIYNQEITLDSFRRASARVFFNEVQTPVDCNEDVSSIYDAHSARFRSLLNCLQTVTSVYLDSVKSVDKKLYPSQEINMTTFVELHDLGHYGLRGKTANIFQNVPARKTRQSSSMMDVRGQLPDPKKLRSAKKQQNLQALATNKDVKAVSVTERVLGHWPDSEGFIRALAEKQDLSSVQIHIPEVYDAQGTLIHPSDYEQVLTCGKIVEVEFTFHIWDITKAANGKAINKPNRICSNVIQKISVIPDDEDDIRVMLHTEAVKQSQALERQEEEIRIAEEARELARREEVLRLEQTMAKAKLVAETKKKRLELLRTQSIHPSPKTLPQKRGILGPSEGPRASKRLASDVKVMPGQHEQEQVVEDMPVDFD
ncbi:hypothetical protein C8J55DRAFT_563568 [Lentinula edodes]|uniref:Uncharacterized protein n=1 Tax=Lentinula lateritia TaxID=40482 RepID=A0A9W9DHQ5_9AGAR|nr:hypothetical protein GG344DRAFT_70001 [Lentinula edodes]KAJ4471271.1 hypothetical protein C8J55DRAFT_563568 [Lentinula edodes]